MRQILSSGACFVTGEAGTKEIRITGLPGHISKIFSDIAAGYRNLEGAEARVKKAEQYYASLPSFIYGATDAQLNDLEMKKRKAMATVQEARNNQENANRNLMNLLSAQKAMTTFSARQTGKRYGQWEIWEYAGPAVAAVD